MTQQPDAVRERLARGEAAFGTMAFEFFTPGLFAIAGQAGADFIILDTEHSGVGPDTIKAQIAAARGTNVEPYVRVPGIDVGWLGHYDLTDSMGFAGSFDRPEFKAAVATLVAACQRHHKTAGYLAADIDTARSWRAKGFRCLGYGTDVGLFRDGLERGLSVLKADEKGGP